MTDIAAQVGRNTDRLDSVEECLSEVGDAVLGSRRSTFAGGDRREDGLIHTAASTGRKVDDVVVRLGRVEAQISNGGIRLHLSGPMLVFLGTTLAAIIGAIATILVRVI